MSGIEVAFFIGLFGSIHCIGMCGPLALAIPFTGSSRWLLLWDKLLYQFGRIFSYTVLGIIAGIIGQQLWMLNIQNGISIASGVLVILAASSRLFNLRFMANTFIAGPVNNLLAAALKNRAGHLYLGMLNGLLPCGFVYLALVGAINMGSIGSSAKYMLFYGLGTLPLMYAAMLGAGYFTVSFRSTLNKIVPYFMLCLGIWFIIRGLPGVFSYQMLPAFCR